MWFERGVQRTLAVAVLLASNGALAGSAHGTGLADRPHKPPTPVRDITTEYEGKVVAVQGAVTGARSFKAGTRFTVNDGTGAIALVLFDRTLKQAPKIDVGATVAVTGTVEFYKKQAQLVPARGKDVRVVAPAPEAPPPVEMHTLGAAKRSSPLTVRGVVVDASHFTAGFKFTLDDGSGRIKLVLFESVYDRLTELELLNVGATVTATGMLDEYAGELQLTPDSAAGVFAEAGAHAVPTHTLGTLTGNDHNAIVQVGGEIESVTPVEAGTELMLKDASGVQKIRLDRVVAERLAKSLTLSPGERIIVTGRVRASRKNGLRIDVALPVDVRAEIGLKE